MLFEIKRRNPSIFSLDVAQSIGTHCVRGFSKQRFLCGWPISFSIKFNET